MDVGVLIPILAVAGFFASIIIFTYMFFSSRHRERMALIESGQDARIFRKSKFADHQENLKYGIVAVLSGVGLIAGYFLRFVGLEAFVAYLSMVLIFGGTGLVLFYMMMQGKGKEEFVGDE